MPYKPHYPVKPGGLRAVETMNVNELDKDMHAFRETRRRLPLRTEALTQLGRGTFHADVNVFAAPEATLYLARVNMRSTTLADLHEDYTGLVFPLSWQREFVINGEEVNARSIYGPVDGTLFQVYGDQRETVAVALPRKDFLATIAALGGVDVDGVQFDGGPIETAASLMASARRSLSTMIREYARASRCNDVSPGAGEMLSSDIVGILTDLYLQARPVPVPRVRVPARLGRIVRKAEDYFAEKQPGPVSLADLCAVAGVSQRTLYHAFLVMCGDSPMAYFKKRRLTDARLALLDPGPVRRLVKRAALNAGLTHFGRFSAEYRELFGESPTTTLEMSSG